MASGIRLELRKLRGDEDPSDISKRVFGILAEYVQPSNHDTPSQTAAKLDELAPEEDEEDDESYEEESLGRRFDFLSDFWETFRIVACQVEYHHLSQDRLVDLAEALQSISGPSGQDHSVWSLRHPLWSLKYLRYYLLKDWCLPSDTNTSYDALIEWVNINAFVARLVLRRLVDWHLFRPWIMRELAITNEDTLHGQNMVRYCQIKATEEWMTYASLDIWTARQMPAWLSDQPELWDSEFWWSWKQSLQELLEGGELNELARGSASRTLWFMECAEMWEGRGPAG